MNIISALVFFASINLLIFIEIVESSCGNFNLNNSNNSENMPGAPTKTDPNSKDVERITKRLMSEMNSAPHINCKANVKTLQAYTQVVSGTSTTLKMKICPYDCVDKTTNKNDCKICTATVWEKPWENFFNVTCFSCD